MCILLKCFYHCFLYHKCCYIHFVVVVISHIWADFVLIKSTDYYVYAIDTNTQTFSHPYTYKHVHTHTQSDMQSQL